MMRSSIYNVIDKMNELEKKADRINDKACDAEENGNAKKAEYYSLEEDIIRAEIEGMSHCLKILGMNPWVQCNWETNHLRVWHIPLDDIERVC